MGRKHLHDLVQRYRLILGFFVCGWHALRLCEGRDLSDIHHALRKASERATPKLSCNAALGTFCSRLPFFAPYLELAAYITRLIALMIMFLLTGCDGAQSSLEPAGRSAEKIADLFWWMAGGAAIIWTTVVGLTFYSVSIAPGIRARQASWMIIALRECTDRFRDPV